MYMNMNMCIVMYMNIYISPTNEINLRQEKSMSGLVNRLLAEYYAKEEMDGEGGVGLQPVGLSEVFAEEENDNLRNWVLVEAEQVVYDTETGERMDVTPEDVQELKRRGQVK